MAWVARRLPKVTFSAAAAPAPDALPPMDVAAFVGFTASGPIDVPVAVYDPVQFAQIFGDDLLLAYTRDGEPVWGHLAASVRAFFRSGGRKCYVVRVAADDAESNGFLVPGLMAAAGEPSGYSASILWARSEGPWSDGLRVGAALRPEPYAACTAQEREGVFELLLAGAGTPIPQAGDLIRVEHTDRVMTGPLSRSTRLYLFAARVDESARRAGSAAAARKARVAGSEHWFDVVSGSGTPAEPLAAEVRLLPAWPERRAKSSPPTSAAVHPARWFLPAESGAPHRIVLPLGAGASPGALVEIVQVEDESGAALARGLLAGVTQVRTPSQEELEAVRGLGSDRWLTALAREVLAPLHPEMGKARFLLAPAGSLRADRLTFDLWTQDERGRTAELTRLGFAPLSPRYVGYLPSDRELYSRERWDAPRADGPLPGSALWQEVEHPRFPLASWPAERETARGPAAAGGEPPAYFLPIGMESGRRIEATAGRRIASEPAPAAGSPDAARRGGLVRFAAELFLDPDLSETPAELLADAAFHKQYVQGRPLRRLHAVMPLDEVTVLSVPDGVHAAWHEEPPAPVRALQPPHLEPVSVSETEVQVRWSPVDPAGGGPVEYLLEEAPDPQFATVTRRWRTREPAVSFVAAAACAAVRYYRARAEERGLVGPWSNTQVARWPKRAFEACQLALPPHPVPAAPVLQAPEPMPDGRFKLAWSPVAPPLESASGECGEAGEPADAGDLEYVLMQAESPDFRDGLVVHRGSDPVAHLFVPGGGTNEVLYFRVRAELGAAPGPWSNSVVLVRPGAAAGRLIVEPAAAEAEAEKVHTAMLNACAARGDMTCVMAVPAGYEAERAAAYAARLAGAFGAGRDRALGWGALYYPWTWTAQAGRAARLIPPDGSVAGSIASRSLERGAWVAPANVVLTDVVALEFDPDETSLEKLYGAGINLIVKEARGFTLLGADTLSRDAALRPLSVRRLLILIRKVALREGQPMVFAPNDEALRRRIRRRFESIFSQLFVRGAFAGTVPEEGFRVITEEPGQIAASADQGRVVVDLCIAPSRPLEFIKVRLVQTERGNVRLVEGD